MRRGDGLAAWEPTVVNSLSTAPGAGWGTRADTAVSHAMSLDKGTGSCIEYAWLAQGLALRRPGGWADPDAHAYLGKTLAQRHPNGPGDCRRPFGVSACVTGDFRPARRRTVDQRVRREDDPARLEVVLELRAAPADRDPGSGGHVNRLGAPTCWHTR